MSYSNAKDNAMSNIDSDLLDCYAKEDLNYISSMTAALNTQDKSKLIKNANAALYEALSQSLRSVDIDILIYISSLLKKLDTWETAYDSMNDDETDEKPDLASEIKNLGTSIVMFYAIAQSHPESSYWMALDFTHSELADLIDSRLVDSLKNRISPLDFETEISLPID